jgi:hypothetical protein
MQLRSRSGGLPVPQVTAEDEPVDGRDDGHEGDHPGGEDTGRGQHGRDSYEQEQLAHPIDRVLGGDDDGAVQASEGGILQRENPPEDRRDDEQDG